MLNFFKVIRRTHRLYLRQQVGILTAWNFIFINLCIWCFHFTFESSENLTYPFIVMTQLNQLIRIQTSISFRAAQRFYHCIHRRLTSQGTHRLNRQVHNIHPCLWCHQHCADAIAGCIMCVQMQWNVHLFLQCLEQLFRCIRLQQTSPILDRKNMTSHCFQFFCFLNIIIQCVFGFFGI